MAAAVSSLLVVAAAVPFDWAPLAEGSVIFFMSNRLVLDYLQANVD